MNKIIRLGILNLPKSGLQLQGKCPVQAKIYKSLNLEAKSPTIECIRTTTFFTKLNAEAVWKSINTVSNAGKKRGRGRSSKRRQINLNIGQYIGCGKENIRWPGLNTNVLNGTVPATIEKLPENPNHEEMIMAARKKFDKKTRQGVHPLERGWSGRSLLGKSLGPPIDLEHSDDFDSYVLESKYLKLTNAKLGKVRSVSAFVVVGNKKGLIGISSAKAPDMKGAVKRAQKRASRKLFYINLEDGHTVNHDFFYQFGITKLFVYKKPPGYGLVCNRGIAVCCKLIGIQDIYAKVEKSTNKQNVVKAFLLGLLEQKTYQQMADENNLHLVEQRAETYMFPTVKASPKFVLPKKDDSLLYTQYVMGGKLPLRKEKQHVEGYSVSFGRFLKRMHYMRNQRQVKRRLLAECGGYKSHLTEIYPECQAPYSFIVHKNKQSTEN